MKPESIKVIEALVAASQPFIVAEVRGQSIERIFYVDRKTGKQTHFDRFVFNTEALGEAAAPNIITTNIPTDLEVQYDETNKKCTLHKKETGKEQPMPYKKGDKVLFLITGFEMDRGISKLKSASHQKFAIE